MIIMLYQTWTMYLPPQEAGKADVRLRIGTHIRGGAKIGLGFHDGPNECCYDNLNVSALAFCRCAFVVACRPCSTLQHSTLTSFSASSSSVPHFAYVSPTTIPTELLS